MVTYEERQELLAEYQAFRDELETLYHQLIQAGRETELNLENPDQVARMIVEDVVDDITKEIPQEAFEAFGDRILDELEEESYTAFRRAQSNWKNYPTGIAYGGIRHHMFMDYNIDDFESVGLGVFPLDEEERVVIEFVEDENKHKDVDFFDLLHEIRGMKQYYNRNVMDALQEDIKIVSHRLTESTIRLDVEVRAKQLIRELEEETNGWTEI